MIVIWVWIRKFPKTIAWLAAFIAFMVNTRFSYLTVHDSKDATEAAKEAAQASLQIQQNELGAAEKSAQAAALTIEQQRAPTLFVSCSTSITEIPNTPSTEILYIGDHRRKERRSFSDESIPELPFKIPNTAIRECRLYNYGAIPVVNAYVAYDAMFFTGRLKKPFDIPQDDRYEIFAPAIPANSSIEFKIENTSFERAVLKREAKMRYEAPPDYAARDYWFHEEHYDFVCLEPGQYAKSGVGASGSGKGMRNLSKSPSRC